MIHIAICDDEKHMSDQIKGMVSDFFRDKNMEISVSQFANAEDLLRYGRKIDILFLDIRIGETNGIETARKLRDHKFKGFLIFITVLKEMVFQSFEVQAYDYLVKPVEKGQFKRTMERLFTAIQDADEANLLVQKGYESTIVPFDDIVFCEIIDRKVYLHLRSGDVIDYYDKMENLETKLDNRFFKCHRSFLINLKYLKSYRNGAALMEDGREVPVSRLRNREFSSVVLQYMKNI